jgi:hypothetical protein
MMNRKDSEGSGSDLIVMLRTEENDETSSVKTAGVSVEIRTNLQPNTSPHNYRHVNPLNAMIL